MSNGDRIASFNRFSEPFIRSYSINTGDRIDRTTALGLLKEIDSKVVEESYPLLPKLLSFLKHNDPVVVRQSISTGTNLFCAVLTEMALQIHNSDNIDGWLAEMWNGMLQFKDAVKDMLRHDSPAVKSLAVKFLENCFLLFTSDGSDVEEGKGCKFNISLLARVHPMLNPAMLAFEASKILNIFLDILKSAQTLSGPLVITTINCLASIAKKRPVHYHSILSSLLNFDPNFGTITGSHAASIQYAVRLAILGFLRCTHSPMFESRENLLRALRSKYPGEGTEQSIRQMEKISRNLDRSSREARPDKDGQQIDEIPSKKLRLSTSDVSNNNSAINNSDPTPAEQMLIAIGALLAEGEKGCRSLELLIGELDTDLLADIVIESMKQFPESPPPLPARNGNMLPNSHITVPSVYSQTEPNIPSTFPSDVASTVAGTTDTRIPASDKQMIPNNFSDSKRDPRRDPRRLDPRRLSTPNDGISAPLNSESINDIQYNSINSSKTSPPFVEDEKIPLINEAEFSDNSIDHTEDHIEFTNSSLGMDPIPPNSALSPENTSSLEIDENEDDYVDSIVLEHDQDSSLVSVPLSSEDVSNDYPEQPLFIDMEDEQKKALCRFSITRLIDGPTQIPDSSHGQTRLQLLARMVAQMDADDDLITFFRRHIILDYHHNKGHDLAMYVLYHLRAVAVSESDEHIPSASKNYEKFLVAIAKILLDAMPASDKSFSRLLGEAPFLPESAFKLLEDLCQLCGYENHTKDTSDADRISQGLSALWSLILGRPNYRHACLDIALKCTIHPHEEVRAKAIRLVSNKLFNLPYASKDIEKFAQSTLLSAIDHQVSETETKEISSEHTIEASSKEISISPSHSLELGTFEDEHLKNIHAASLLSAQQQTSLFFSLCSKKPALFHLLFNIYGRAPKVVKQSIHRNVPNLIKTLAPSYAELLLIISDPPEGSENLIILVLQLITEETTPSADLITAVKHLYDTKLKDVSILIPMLSSLSKAEVLPIFPRLVNLQLEKFQAALARILQGSAHTGPALTPFEVLIAIHDVDPSRDGVPLKKITDACTACFEQRTVFTQQVLAKSLSHMVEQVPLPMLFMRTLIQSVNTFPVMVDFAMGILSKLVNRQIWKMPKFWVGFLKLVSQTHPLSFSVLLQLPSPQLENALNKYVNLKAPLVAYASQPIVRATLERSTLQVLGLDILEQSPTSRSFPPADSNNASFHRAALS